MQFHIVSYVLFNTESIEKSLYDQWLQRSHLFHFENAFLNPPPQYKPNQTKPNEVTHRFLKSICAQHCVVAPPAVAIFGVPDFTEVEWVEHRLPAWFVRTVNLPASHSICPRLA